MRLLQMRQERRAERMRAIYKKELRTYLTSMTGYIFMAVLLAVASLYFVANCLIGGYPVFGVVLSSEYS